MNTLTTVRERVMTYGHNYLTDQELLILLKSKAPDIQSFFTTEQGKAFYNLYERYKNLDKSKATIKCSQTAFNVISYISQFEVEHFVVIYCNKANKVITTKEISKGGIGAAYVCPNTIIRTALQLNATAIVLAHNHPSGQPKPSIQDRNITKDIKAAAALFSINVLDHLIVCADDAYYSFADEGAL